VLHVYTTQGSATAVCYTPCDANVIASAGADGSIIITDKRTPGAQSNTTYRCDGALTSLSFHESGSIVAAGGTDGAIYTLDRRMHAEADTGTTTCAYTGAPQSTRTVMWKVCVCCCNNTYTYTSYIHTFTYFTTARTVAVCSHHAYSLYAVTDCDVCGS
jgi:WD40 repeat protein